MCLKVPFLGKLPGAKGTTDQHPDRFWSCSHIASLKPEQATKKEFKQGNYVQFDVQMIQNTQFPVLNIIDINERYCDPPEKECNFVDMKFPLSHNDSMSKLLQRILMTKMRSI